MTKEMTNAQAIGKLNLAVMEASNYLRGSQSGGPEESEAIRQTNDWAIALKIATTELEKPKREKFFTCFGFEHQTDLKSFHITHSYFGELSPTELFYVKGVLDNHFSKHYYQALDMLFDQVDWFGRGKDIRVLKPLSFDPKAFLPELRKELHSFCRGEFYPDYQPHVTNPTLKAFGGKINALYLVRNDYTILAKY